MKRTKVFCQVIKVIGLTGSGVGLAFRPAYALTSLMFTADEINHISHQSIEEPVKLHSGILQCEGILYSDRNNKGHVWLNGQCYTQEKMHQIQKVKQRTILIHRITAETVDLSWFYKGKEHRIILKPNQSYNARLQKVKG